MAATAAAVAATTTLCNFRFLPPFFLFYFKYILNDNFLEKMARGIKFSPCISRVFVLFGFFPIFLIYTFNFSFNEWLSSGGGGGSGDDDGDRE